MLVSSLPTPRSAGQAPPPRLGSPATQDTQSPPLRYLANDRAQTAESAVRAVRQRSNSILQAQFTAAEGETGVRVRTEPPTHDELFDLKSQQKTYYILEKEFLTRTPDQLFLVPIPFDEFTRPDAPVLGVMWWQNRKTGSHIGVGERRGEMGVVKYQGVYPAGAKPEAAIISESTGEIDMAVSVRVSLGTPESQFGVVLRSQDPHKTSADPIDQTDTNSYYYAVANATSVAIGKRVKGTDTVLKRAAGLAAKQQFRLTAVAFGDRIAVSRDDEVVLEIADGSLQGEFGGLMGMQSGARPTTFDDFRVRRYGGAFSIRAYAESTSSFPGANVHYRPLYFEQHTLERYGHHLGNLFQPLIAHAEFFGDAAMLPYSIGKSPPWQNHSAEGYAMPGDVILPFRVQGPQWDRNGAAMQTAVMVLGFALLP